MALDDLPLKVASANNDGINDAWDAVVLDSRAVEAVRELLRENPKSVIRRVLRLNPYQRAALGEMTDDEVRSLVAPALEALSTENPASVRVRIIERVVTESPFKIKCSFEYES